VENRLQHLQVSEVEAIETPEPSSFPPAPPAPAPLPVPVVSVPTMAEVQFDRSTEILKGFAVSNKSRVSLDAVTLNLLFSDLSPKLNQLRCTPYGPSWPHGPGRCLDTFI